MGSDWLECGMALHRFCGFPTRDDLSVVNADCDLLKVMEFWEEPKGANLWLVIPDDEGVFHGSKSQDRIRCVSPVQAYLDLKNQPERAKDAALDLRRKLLNWGQREP